MTAVAIVGSRTWPTPKDIEAFVNSLAPDDVVISGGAQGADEFAAKAAEHRGITVIRHLPDKQRYGSPKCFYERNKLIVEDVKERGGKVLAYAANDPKTKKMTAGTAMTKGIAERAGVPVEVIETPVPGWLCVVIHRLRGRYDNIRGASTDGERNARIDSAMEYLNTVIVARDKYENRLADGYDEIELITDESEHNRLTDIWLEWKCVYECLCDVVTEAQAVMVR